MFRPIYLFTALLLGLAACGKDDGTDEPACPGGLADPVSGQYAAGDATFQPAGSSQVGPFTDQSLQVTGVDCNRVNVQVIPFGYAFNADLVIAVSSPRIIAGYSDDNKVTMEYREATRELTVRLSDSTGVYIFTGKK
jgi:hypothetical protein